MSRPGRTLEIQSIEVVRRVEGFRGLADSGCRGLGNFGFRESRV